MARSLTVSALGPEFENFLFSPIGEDRNDMPVSVLSALARLGFDPWQEAAELAQLPRETATRRLASSIAALPDWPTAHLQDGTIAARLVALLPRKADPETVSRDVSLNVDDVTKFRSGMYMYVVLIVVMLTAQWLVTGPQAPPAADGGHAPAAGAVSPQPPQPNSGE
jgi:hypothetical protein